MPATEIKQLENTALEKRPDLKLLSRMTVPVLYYMVEKRKQVAALNMPEFLEVQA